MNDPLRSLVPRVPPITRAIRVTDPMPPVSSALLATQTLPSRSTATREGLLSAGRISSGAAAYSPTIAPVSLWIRTSVPRPVQATLTYGKGSAIALICNWSAGLS